MVSVPTIIQADAYSRSTLADLSTYSFQIGQTKIAQANNPEADKLLQEAIQTITSRKKDDYQQALKKLQRALTLYQAAKNEKSEYGVLLMMSALYTELGDTQQAAKYRNQAFEKAPKNNTPQLVPSGEQGNSLEADTLVMEAGRLLMQTGQRADRQPQALDKLEKALKLYQAVKNKEKEKSLLAYIAEIYRSSGDTKKAEEYKNRSNSITIKYVRDTSGDKMKVISPILLNARTSIQIGEYERALDYINRIDSISNGDKKIDNITFSHKSLIYYNLGAYQEALTSANKLTSIDEDEENLFLIGKIHYELGAYEKALNYYDRFRAVKERKNKAQGIVPCSMLDRVQSGSQTGTSETLREYYQNECDKVTKSEDFSLIPLGDVYRKLGNNQQALIYYKQALVLSESQKQITENNSTLDGARLVQLFIDNKSSTIKKAEGLNGIGKIYKELGDNKQSFNNLSQALAIYRSANNKIAQPDILFDLAFIYRSESKLDKALTEIDSAIKIIEGLRTKIISPDLRISYFASVQKYYRLKIDLLMQLHQQKPNTGYDTRAIEASESARARGLLDLLIEAKADIKQGVDPQLLAQERAIQSKLDAAEKRRISILNKQGTLPPEFEQEYNRLNQQYEQNKDQIRLKSPRYAAITQPKPLKFAQIQQLLDDKTILLEYSLGENQSYLWLVTKNRIDSYQLPKSAEIKNIVDKYLPILTSKSGYTTAKIQIEKIAPQLKAILPDAVANKLTNKRLVIVADGALQYLPFGSLPTGADNQPLLLTNEVINLPSASTLGILREQNLRSQAAKTVAVFADPVFASDDARLTNKPAKTTELSTETRSLQSAARENGIKFSRLTNTKKEAETILQLSGDRGKLNLDFDANLVNATNSDLVNYRIVHFATHGIMDGIDPKRSGVVLSLFNKQGRADNGYLRLPNIFNLKLDADLVVLSACQTGIGKEIQGEGLVGLTRGFMYAGTPRVVVSLWNVDDEATSILMGNFYTGILKQGLTPAAALRQAQQTMMRDPKYQSPYYWAAFTLQGEWQ